MSDLSRLHRAASQRMEDIADLLPVPYRLTLIARHTERPNADIILTDDDVDEAVRALRALAGDTSAITVE